MNARPEAKREEFRRYLEKAGVMDALTRVLVGLYEEPEKPSNAIGYFLERMSSGGPMKGDLESMTNEMMNLQQKIAILEEENQILRGRLVELQHKKADLDDGVEA